MNTFYRLFSSGNKIPYFNFIQQETNQLVNIYRQIKLPGFFDETATAIKIYTFICCQSRMPVTK